MNRRFLLAAETFNYSFNKYADKVEIGAERFTRLMPQDIDILEKADNEKWSLRRLSKALNVDPENAEILRRSYYRAKDIIDAPTPAESFRRAVRHSIRYALSEGLNKETDIEKLVGQICYRAADLSYLLDLKNQKLSDYSEEFRKIPTESDLFDRI